MNVIFKKVWRALVVFWTVLGAIVFFLLLVTIVSVVGSRKWKSSNEISTEEYCHRYQVGSPFLAVQVASDWHQVQMVTGRLVSPIGTIELTRQKISDESRQKTLAVLGRIDEQGLAATLWITDTLFLLKKTCEISFEHGLVSKVDYRTWD